MFIRSDFNDLGGYAQVGRVLRTLTDDGLLIKMGYGVYVKARRNRFTNEIMPDIDGGIDAAFIEALNQLNVGFDFDELTTKYLRGEITQIPVKISFIIKKRFSRKLSIGNVFLND
ncbi:S-adenosylhomocysteine hydrolase [Photobacterium leiognathi]|uniref:S-adenosylhomocysteine hydrolase n=1 Tax=Photobacterium leiognathi TaxID=553611 RepID=UPI002980BB86|nr:S-adenosylhomocysteine hydrolase [Photobacterium leiognathi]